MSSAIVEKALEKEAEKNNVELESSAVGSGEAEHAVANQRNGTSF